jgi:hypothetical protein
MRIWGMRGKGYATSREFREANERILGVLAERGASKLLGDIKELVLIGADDQHWLSTNWIPRAVEAGCARWRWSRPCSTSIGSRLRQKDPAGAARTSGAG